MKAPARRLHGVRLVRDVEVAHDYDLGLCVHAVGRGLHPHAGLPFTKYMFLDPRGKVDRVNPGLASLLVRKCDAKDAPFHLSPGLYDADVVCQLWMLFGVPANMVDEVAAANPRWRNGRLFVSGAMRGILYADGGRPHAGLPSTDGTPRVVARVRAASCARTHTEFT